MARDSEFRELNTLFLSGRHQLFQKGEIIVRADENPRGVYLIKSGIVKIYALSRHNDQHIHHFFGPGDFFPITWIFQDEPRNLYYECIENVEVSVVAKDDFFDFIMKNENVMLEMLKEMNMRYIRYAGRIENLLYSNAQERCAYRLLSLCNRFGVVSEDGLVIKANITHEDMARSLNMTRETFSRTLGKLQQRDVVGYDEQRHLVINKIDQLIKTIGKSEVEAMWPKLNKYLTEAVSK